MTAQELRRTKYSGEFASTAEDLTEFLLSKLPSGFPNFAAASQRQMKDVEFVAQPLLLTEIGPQTSLPDDLDEGYGARDEAWEAKATDIPAFEAIVGSLAKLSRRKGNEATVKSSRFLRPLWYVKQYIAYVEASRGFFS